MSTDNIYRSVIKNTNEEVLVYKNIFGEYKDLRSKRTFLENELEDFRKNVFSKNIDILYEKVVIFFSLCLLLFIID